MGVILQFYNIQICFFTQFKTTMKEIHDLQCPCYPERIERNTILEIEIEKQIFAVRK